MGRSISYLISNTVKFQPPDVLLKFSRRIGAIFFLLFDLIRARIKYIFGYIAESIKLKNFLLEMHDRQQLESITMTKYRICPIRS